MSCRVQRALRAVLLGALCALAAATAVAVPPRDAGAVTTQQAGTYVPVAPARLLDTRTGTGGKAPAANGTVHLQVLGRASVPASGVAAVALNVTVTAPARSGYISVYADGTTRPTVSNLNFRAHQTAADLTVTRLGAGGRVALTNRSPGSTQLIADVAGYWLSGTPSAAGSFATTTPTRLLDTRTGLGGTRPGSRGTTHLSVLGRGGVPSTGVAAVTVTLTVTEPAKDGYVTAYPDGGARPTASNVNFAAGRTVADLAVVRVGANGRIALFNGAYGAVQLVVDVVGWTRSGVASAAGALDALAPARLLDSRLTASPPAGNQTTSLPVLGRGGVPSTGVRAVVLTVAAVSPQSPGDIRVFAAGSTVPTTSNVNFTTGQVVANLVVAQVGANGAVSLNNQSPGQTPLVVDVTGYYLSSHDAPPLVSATAAGVSARALPTVQIDGVVWSQAIVGTTVYAGGNFGFARPAGAAPGMQQTARANLLAYNLTTGALLTTFAPTLNSDVKAVAASPDGSRVYVGGAFTTANGQQRYRLAAYDTATGALDASFHPTLDATVNALTVTNSTVYAGGTFSTVNGVARSRLAAFSAASGALTAWAPVADNIVDALQLTPDGTHVIVGGAFGHLGGAVAPGVGSVSSASGASAPFAVNQVVQDSGSGSAILSLSTDGTAVYGTGYSTTNGFEGVFSANPTTGAVNWLEDCHGDSYGVFASPAYVYTVSHAHFCGNVNGFPETAPRTYQRTVAFTRKATGAVQPNIDATYGSFTGQPAPSLVTWFPDLDEGTVTGQHQGPWTVTGTSRYVVEGGEFEHVNGVAQQGLVRFAVPAVAPDNDGPVDTTTANIPTLSAVSHTSVRLTWLTNWDRDDANLTYRVYRNGVVVHTATAVSTFWNRPYLTFTDTGLPAGKTAFYHVDASDAAGNSTRGGTASITP